MEMYSRRNVFHEKLFQGNCFHQSMVLRKKFFLQKCFTVECFSRINVLHEKGFTVVLLPLVRNVLQRKCFFNEKFPSEMFSKFSNGIVDKLLTLNNLCFIGLPTSEETVRNAKYLLSYIHDYLQMQM